jgi:hypothetical protein
MSKKPEKEYEGRITCIQGSAAVYVGTVTAPDAGRTSIAKRAVAARLA